MLNYAPYSKIIENEHKKRMSERLTMADIGRLAGVSASTVSRALKGSASIPEATRERILKIARDNNYVLDARAQNFRLQRSSTIATVFPYLGESHRMISDPFYMEMVGAITEELDEHGYDMIVSRVQVEANDWVLRYVMEKRVDGLILIDRSMSHQEIQQLQTFGAKFVVWGAALPGQDYVSVGCDGVQGGAMAVKHLARLGRRKIAFIGGYAHMVETEMRYQGYQQGLRECDLPYDDTIITFTDFTPQAGSKAIRQLLERAPDIDGVFICSDFMSIAVMEFLRSTGRRIPDDISVVGYDDIQLAAHCSPRLTTLRQQIGEGGHLMVRKLFELIDGQMVEPATLPIELAIRDSCGANQRWK
jgi:DNA-binding LacI/PurR family transcriptional regulator